MKHFMNTAILTISATAILWGCATIMHGTSQKVGISSTPTGAKVTVDNKEDGVTPIFADLKRGDEHIVKIELEGYQNAELTFTKNVSGWVWGDIGFSIGGLIGLALDALTGGLYNLSPEQLNAELTKQGTSLIEKEGTLYIVTVLRPRQEWKRIRSLIKLE